jgi:hypothetical protein
LEIDHVIYLLLGILVGVIIIWMSCKVAKARKDPTDPEVLELVKHYRDDRQSYHHSPATALKYSPDVKPFNLVQTGRSTSSPSGTNASTNAYPRQTLPAQSLRKRAYEFDNPAFDTDLDVEFGIDLRQFSETSYQATNGTETSTDYMKTVRAKPMIRKGLSAESFEVPMPRHELHSDGSADAKHVPIGSALNQQRPGTLYVYRCVVIGSSGVAMRMSPNFDDKGGQGPRPGDTVESTGEPISRGGVHWIRLSNGVNWLPLTTAPDHGSRRLFELVMQEDQL